MIKRVTPWHHRHAFLYPVFAVLVIALGIGIVRDLQPRTGGTDYCAAANLRACTVKEKGEWVLVVAPDGAQHMIFLKGGKVVTVQ